MRKGDDLLRKRTADTVHERIDGESSNGFRFQSSLSVVSHPPSPLPCLIRHTYFSHQRLSIQPRCTPPWMSHSVTIVMCLDLHYPKDRDVELRENPSTSTLDPIDQGWAPSTAKKSDWRIVAYTAAHPKESESGPLESMPCSSVTQGIWSATVA